MNDRGFADGRVIVIFTDDTSEDEAKKAIESLGLKVIRREYSRRNKLSVEVPIGQEWEWQDKLSKLPKVIGTELIPILRTCDS